MRPTQFGTQCVPNWKHLKKVPHIAEISLVKPLPEPPRQRFRQGRQQPLAIARPRCTALLILHDVPSDLPVGLHLDAIHRPQHLPLGVRDVSATV
jgi:hypothetical protein